MRWEQMKSSRTMARIKWLTLAQCLHTARSWCSLFISCSSPVAASEPTDRSLVVVPVTDKQALHHQLWLETGPLHQVLPTFVLCVWKLWRATTFMIVKSFCCADLFIIIKCPSFSLIIGFVLKSTWTTIKTSHIPAFFWLAYTWHSYFCPFNLNLDLYS